MLHLFGHTLLELNDEMRPSGRFAMGCVVECRGIRYLLTVRHATKVGTWAVELEYEREHGAQKLYILSDGGVSASGRMRKDGDLTKFKEIDFAWHRVPHDMLSKHQEINQKGEILSEEQRLIFSQSDIVAPTETERYFFWGLTDGSYYANNLTRTVTGQFDMRYAGPTPEGLLRFETKEPFRSYKEFVGCSGSPIIGLDGKLVSLVVEGDKWNTAILGLDLRPLSALIEASALDLLGQAE